MTPPALSLVPAPTDDRPIVRLGHEVLDVVDQAAAALHRDPLLFSRDHELVTVVLQPGALPGARAPVAQGTPVVRPVEAPTLFERLTACALFERAAKPTPKELAMREMGGEPEVQWARCNPTPAIVQALLARGRWPIPPLVGISETPIVRRDGTIRQSRGYDETTGWYYAPSCSYPEIAERPSQADGTAALRELEDIFCDFPHVGGAGGAHRHVPVAAILTLLARPAILGSVPMFVLDASTRGSGKTLQADVVSTVALGRDAGRCTYPEDDEELEKVLSSYALSGTSLILIDNIRRPLGGGPLDKVLTARSTVDLRVLGSSVMRQLPWTATILASGNNLELGDDTIRRTLVSRIESQLENPEARTGFAHDPLVEWAKEHRARLVGCALTVLRAYSSHGSPDTDVPRWGGGFESWATVVAGSIRFCGGPNVLLCKPSAEERGDGTVMALDAFLLHLPRLTQGEPVRLKSLLATLYPERDSHDGPQAPDGWEDLREAIETLAPPRHGQGVDPRKLGAALRYHAARIRHGRRLANRSAAAGTVAWYVTNLAGAPVTGQEPPN